VIALWAALVLFAAAPIPASRAAASLIGQDEEIRLGREAAAQLEVEYGLAPDAGMTSRVRALGGRVAAVAARRDLPYTFKVLRGRQVNAVSLPGGFIYATEGLMGFVQSDAELGFVLAHEVGHVAARHHVTMIERSLFLGLASRLLLGGDGSAAQVGRVVRFLLTRGFSREHEFEADRLAVAYAHRSGLNAAASLEFLGRLRAVEGRDPDRVEVLLRTHPALADRIARVRTELRALGYRIPSP
jgi:predicted Zn-dependent protease